MPQVVYQRPRETDDSRHIARRTDRPNPNPGTVWMRVMPRYLSTDRTGQCLIRCRPGMADLPRKGEGGRS
jgi:hypothetical protein